MKRLIVALLLSCGLLSTAHAQGGGDINRMSSAQIVSQAGSLHPSALYVLSSRLMAEGKGQEAAKWMYAGQLRYRFLLAALGNAGRDEQILFSALTEQVGRPVNQYIAGNPDEWIAAMKWALDWDAATANGVTSKTRHAAELARVRNGLAELIVEVDTSRDQIRRQRRANGMRNR